MIEIYIRNKGWLYKAQLVRRDGVLVWWTVLFYGAIFSNPTPLLELDRQEISVGDGSSYFLFESGDLEAVK